MISIIIPTLNRCDLLKKTIESILKHNKNYELYELIVVDNGSSDATKNIFEDIKLANKEAKLNYFYDDIPGLLTGRHRGAKEAKGVAASWRTGGCVGVTGGGSMPFKIGDIVKLKSGGPKMTVVEMKEKGDGVEALLCVWFAGSDFSKPEAYVFVAAGLMPCSA